MGWIIEVEATGLPTIQCINLEFVHHLPTAGMSTHEKFRIKLARQSMEAKIICRHRVPDFANIDTVELRRTTHHREDT